MFFEPGQVPPAARAAEAYWGDRFSLTMLADLPRLRWIHCASVGFDKVAVPEVKARGITVTNSAGLFAAPVATATVGLITALARGYHHAWRLRREGRLDRVTLDVHFDEVRDLEGDRVLIAGLGDIGRRVATACAALGMHVSAVRSKAGPAPRGIERVYGPADLRRAVKDADFVVNLLPLTSRSTKVFDRSVFAAMKRGAFFVNTGRGATVDEAALVAALRSGRLAGAGLDVYATEPLPRSSPLWNLDNVILTPHTACVSGRYWPRQVELFAENARRLRAKRPLLNRVNLEKGY